MSFFTINVIGTKWWQPLWNSIRIFLQIAYACVLMQSYMIIRYLSIFFDCLAHPNLSSTLATDKQESDKKMGFLSFRNIFSAAVYYQRPGKIQFHPLILKLFDNLFKKFFLRFRYLCVTRIKTHSDVCFVFSFGHPTNMVHILITFILFLDGFKRFVRVNLTLRLQLVKGIYVPKTY